MKLMQSDCRLPAAHTKAVLSYAFYYNALAGSGLQDE